MATDGETKLEYKVVLDRSVTTDNKVEAIERKINEAASQGWRLDHVTSFATHDNSNVYLIFQRDKACA